MIKKVNSRNSTIELLRIFSMFAIVIHHYAIHGTYHLSMAAGEVIKGVDKTYLMLHFAGRVGVTVFVLIGAYFLSAKKFNFKRPINLILTMYFYSWIIFLVFKIFDPKLVHETLGGNVWLKVMVPYLLPTNYWFVNAYVIMLLLMPYLNKVLNNVSKHQLQCLLILLFVVDSVFPTLAIMFPRIEFDVANLGYSTGSYFIFLYFLAGYLQRYGSSFLFSMKCSLIVITLCLGIIALISQNPGKLHSYEIINSVFEMYNPICVMLSFYVFNVCLKINHRNRLINYLSGSMFAVYLISDNVFVRKIIWQQIFPSGKASRSAEAYLLLGLKASMCIFVITIVIDLVIRRLLFIKAINWGTTKIDFLCQRIFFSERDS